MAYADLTNYSGTEATVKTGTYTVANGVATFTVTGVLSNSFSLHPQFINVVVKSTDTQTGQFDFTITYRGLRGDAPYSQVSTSTIYDDANHVIVTLPDATSTPQTVILSNVPINVGDQIVIADNGTPDFIACILRGVRVSKLVDGEWVYVPVETIEIGDTVQTGDGRAERVRWIGRRTYRPRFNKGHEDRALPVRFAAGCFGGGLPIRDVVLSQEHAILHGGILINASALVNGVNVTLDRGIGEIDLYNIMLDQHGTVLVEGIPCETWMNHNTVWLYQNKQDFLERFGLDEVVKPPTEWQAFCAPRIITGPIVDDLRTALLSNVPAAAA